MVFLFSRRVGQPSAGSFALVREMANEQNLMPIEEVNSRRTREQHSLDSRKAGKRSGEVRRENKLIKDRILERMGESDWDEMIDNLIARAKDDRQDFETLRDTIGQKPKDTVAVQKEHIVIRRHRNDD